MNQSKQRMPRSKSSPGKERERSSRLKPEANINRSYRGNKSEDAHPEVSQGFQFNLGKISIYPEDTISGVGSEENPQRELLRNANRDPGILLDQSFRKRQEKSLGVDLTGVRVHSGQNSNAAADGINARAYTIGTDIHLGEEARSLNESKREQLLTHEVVHTVQQGGKPVSLQGNFRVSNSTDPSEAEADRIAHELSSEGESQANSLALKHRNSLRGTSITPIIQRDIKGNQNLKNGKMEIDFKKIDGKVAGDQAIESGKITFTPSAKSPESNAIRFVQIVRTIDVGGATAKAGEPVDWAKVGGGGEAPRNQMLTKGDQAKNIAPDFYVDQEASSLSKRTKQSDPEVLPFYDVTGPAIAGNATGKHKGKAIVPAVLEDVPGSNVPVKVNFVASAKGDTGTWYGTVLWGFEVFEDKSGIAKIKGEYKNFREQQGETTDEAIKQFDEFYQNPGTTNAPTK